MGQVSYVAEYLEQLFNTKTISQLEKNECHNWFSSITPSIPSFWLMSFRQTLKLVLLMEVWY